MDYIYSELVADLASSIDYIGRNSKTARVKIDTTNKTITVDVKPSTNLDPITDIYKKEDGKENYILLVTEDEEGNYEEKWIEIDSLFKKVAHLNYQVIPDLTLIDSNVEI